MHLRNYEDAAGLIVDDEDRRSVLKEAILPHTELHSIITNISVIQVALIAYGLPKGLLSYSIFMM